MKRLLYLFLFISLIFTLSCDNESLEVNDNLVGKWAYSIEDGPQGEIVFELEFKNDATFVSNVSFYGIYAGELETDLSAYTEYTGSFSQQGKSLVLNAKTYTWLDNFYDDPGPFLSASNAILFENCTYKIENNILELTYLTAPTDIPIETIASYLRIN